MYRVFEDSRVFEDYRVLESARFLHDKRQFSDVGGGVVISLLTPIQAASLSKLSYCPKGVPIGAGRATTAGSWPCIVFLMRKHACYWRVF